MEMSSVKTLTIKEQDVAKLGFTNPQGVGEHGLEYRLHIAGRRANDAQHLRRSLLPFRRFVALAKGKRDLCFLACRR